MRWSKILKHWIRLWLRDFLEINENLYRKTHFDMEKVKSAFERADKHTDDLRRRIESMEHLERKLTDLRDEIREARDIIQILQDKMVP